MINLHTCVSFSLDDTKKLGAPLVLQNAQRVGWWWWFFRLWSRRIWYKIYAEFLVSDGYFSPFQNLEKWDSCP